MVVWTEVLQGGYVNSPIQSLLWLPGYQLKRYLSYRSINWPH